MGAQKNLAKNSYQFITPGNMGEDIGINVSIREGYYDWFLDALDDAYESREERKTSTDVACGKYRKTNNEKV